MTSDHPVRPQQATRPRMIVSVIATADGRVALNRSERLLDDDVRARWRSVWPPDVADLVARRTAAIRRCGRPTVVLEGSGTFVADGDGPLDLPPDAVVAEELRQDFLPGPGPNWFAVVDGRGRVPWSRTREGDTRLLVLVSTTTPLPYLAHLRREGVPYLVAGEGPVDLAAALGKIRGRLGAERVVSEGGGGLNGALLRAGLVDELHVITVPALVGGLGTPSVTDGPPLPPGSVPVRLRTVDVTVGSHGTIWAHYEVTTE